MKKYKLKTHLKFFLLLFGISLVLVNCQKDDDFIKTSEPKSNENAYKIRNVSFKDVKENTLVYDKLLNSKSLLKLGNAANKTINDSINGFSINTDTGIYIENGDYHSYTFEIYRTTESNYLLENLVLSKIDSGYETILYQYDVTEAEFDLIAERQFVDLEGKIIRTLLENSNVAGEVLGKYFFNGNCWDDIPQYVPGQNCPNGHDWNYVNANQGTDEQCIYLGHTGGPLPGNWVTQSVQVSCEGTGMGNTNNPPPSPNPNPPNPDHNGGDYNTTSTTTNTTCRTCPGGVPSGPMDGGGNDDDCNTSKDDLKEVFPNTSDERLQEIADAINEFAQDFGVDTKEELQHFLAQAGHESAKFTDFTESLNYRVNKLDIDYWKSKFNPHTSYTNPPTTEVDSTKQNPNDYASSTSTVFVDNEEFANFVYDDANRGIKYKLGNTSVGDGYKYRGRGIFQLTGRNNYTTFNTYYQENSDEDVDLIENPDLVASDMEIAVISALWFFEENVTVHSNSTVKKITKKINGGSNGLADREEIFEECELHIDCVE